MSQKKNFLKIPKFTEQETIKFLELYTEEECLWKLDLKDYKNKIKKEEAIFRVSQRMSIPGFEPSMVSR